MRAFDEAAAAIAGALAPDGFTFAPSGPRASRPAGPAAVPGLRQVLAFTSGHRDRPGYVGLGLFPHVRSPALRRWRAEQGPPSPAADDTVAGAGLGHAAFPHPRSEWNVALPAEVDQVVATVREVVLPWFARFDDREQLAAALSAGDVPAVDIGQAVEYLLCFEGGGPAERAAGAWLGRHPDQRRRFWAYVHRFRGEGTRGPAPGRPVDRLARLVVDHGLAVGGPEPPEDPELAGPRRRRQGQLVIPRAEIAADLRRYGEDDVADLVLRLGGEDLQRVWALAVDHAMSPMSLTRATALAAVEVVEGRPRPLRHAPRRT